MWFLATGPEPAGRMLEVVSTMREAADAVSTFATWAGAATVFAAGADLLAASSLDATAAGGVAGRSSAPGAVCTGSACAMTDVGTGTREGASRSVEITRTCRSGLLGAASDADVQERSL
jgi:hypothetical protein